VYPEVHGKWKKVERFVTWVRSEAAKFKRLPSKAGAP
jgi:hypothetical protein